MTVSKPKSWLDLSPKPLSTLGVRAWLLLGIAGVIYIVIYGLSLTASIVIPLILAVILGILFAPVVDALERRGVPRALGATIGMLLVLAIAGGTIWAVTTSVIGQWPTIQKQTMSAYTSVSAWFATLQIPTSTRAQITEQAQTLAPKIGTWFANLLFSSVTSFAAFLFGTFLAFYMLFFTLKDNELIMHSVGRSVGLPVELGEAIVGDSFTAVRQYFKGTTIIAVITTVATALGLWLIGVPLIVTISVVTFILSYVPFFGAIVSCAFAVLIALGAGGLPMALATLVVCLLAQNVLQSLVQGWAIGGALDLHPIIVLLATTVGGIFGGLIGGMLGAPLAAIAVRLVRRLRAAWDTEEAEAKTIAAEPAEAY
jgi:predicted PurR-regulated permease PerM